MKYLKYFENNNNQKLVESLDLNLIEVLKYIMKDLDIPPIISTITIPSWHKEDKVFYLEYGFKAENNSLNRFIYCKIEFVNNNIEIFFQNEYIDLNIWEDAVKFSDYFISLIKPLSYEHDNDVEFNLRIDNFKKLIKMPTIQDYKIRTEVNKYNL